MWRWTLSDFNVPNLSSKLSTRNFLFPLSGKWLISFSKEKISRLLPIIGKLIGESKSMLKKVTRSQSHFTAPDKILVKFTSRKLLKVWWLFSRYHMLNLNVTEHKDVKTDCQLAVVTKQRYKATDLLYIYIKCVCMCVRVAQ